jgi:NADH-quinone oxidoreductase subunit L
VLTGVYFTALYTFRMFFMTFHGEERLDHHAQEHFHDVGWDMKAPLVALAIPSALIGFFTIQPVLFGGYFGNAIRVLPRNDVVRELGREFEGAAQFALHALISVPFWLAVLGVFSAWLFVLKRPEWATVLRERLSWIYKILVNKYYFDWFNENVLAALSRGLGKALWHGADQAVIDGVAVNGSAHTVGWMSGVLRQLQSGYLYSYAFWMVLGLVFMLGWFLVRI